MRIATWNVNSLTAERIDRVVGWLDIGQPDVLCLQETKLTDDAFPALDFHARGYASVHHGEGRWNGVAILSRVGLDDPVVGLRRRRAGRRRGEAGHRHVRRRPGVVGLRAQRAGGRATSTSTTSCAGWPACAPTGGRRRGRPIRGRGVRRLQRCARRHRRVERRGVRGLDARDARGAGGGGRDRGDRGCATCSASGIPGSRASSAGGTTGPVSSTSTGACAST